MITIKPHHFIDIVKLYGAGIEDFVPDKAFGHDFYRIANLIVNNLENELKLTIDGDDICKPCNRYNGEFCTDPLVGVVKEFDKKDEYNKVLDTRIIKQLKLDTDKIYTAREFLTILYADSNLIFTVWKEEENTLTDRRNQLFRAGAAKLLK